LEKKEYITALSIYFERNDTSGAFDIFKTHRYIPLPSHGMYHKLITSAASFRHANSIYKTMINKHRVKPTIKTFNLLLSHASSRDQVNVVQAKLEYLDISPDLIYYTMLISRYLKYKDTCRAMGHVEEMMGRRDIEPDCVFYGSLLSCLAKLEQVELFERGVELMIQSRIPPNQHILTVWPVSFIL
jgi:hypothetical protein